MRLHAIVAGSYPAFLGRAVKEHNDVDVFIIAGRTGDRNLVQNLLWLLHWSDKSPQYPANEDIPRYGGHIISVRNLGKIQLIIKHYDEHDACLCDFHLHSSFFEGFHHCTRWRLDVFEKFFLVRYMPLERGPDRDVICRKTAIRINNINKRKK